MPSPVKLSRCSCGPTAGVGGILDATSWGDVFGNVLQTGLETGAKFGIQYGLAELTGSSNRPGTPIAYAQPAQPAQPTPNQTAVQPVQMVAQTVPAATTSNLNTTIMLGAAAVVLATILSR